MLNKISSDISEVNEYKKESFNNWQNRIADKINDILELNLEHKEKISHFSSLTNNKTSTWKKRLNEYNKIDTTYNNNILETEHINIENNFLYNIPNIMVYLYQNMGTKTNKIVIALAKVYSKQTSRKLLNIDWFKYNFKLPKEFKEHCDKTVISEKYIQYLLGRVYARRFNTYSVEERKNSETRYSFTELFEKSSLFRKNIEGQLSVIENMEELEYIRYLISKSIDKIPNLRGISYKGWIEYMKQSVEDEKTKLENSKHEIQEKVEMRNVNLLIIKNIVDSIELYINKGKKVINKKTKEELKTEEKEYKFTDKQLDIIQAKVLDFYKKSKKSKEIKEKIIEVLDEYDENDTTKPLSLKIETNFQVEKLKNSNKELKEKESKINHLEKKFTKELPINNEEIKYRNPKSLKSLIDAEKWKQDFRLKKEMKDFRSLDFAEDQAVRQIMSVVSKYKKEETDDGLGDNIPKNFLKSKTFTCFSGTWLVSSLLKEAGFNEKNIFVGLGHVGKGNIIYKHAYVLLKKSNGNFLKIDYGFGIVEDMNPTILNDFLEKDILDKFRKGFNFGYYNVNLEYMTGLDLVGKIYRLKDGLSVGYLTNKAGILFEDKKYKEAKKLLDISLSIDNTNVDSLELLMYIAEIENDKEKIKKYANKLLKFSFLPSANYMLGKLSYDEGDYKKTKEHLKLFINSNYKMRKSNEKMSLNANNILKEIEEKVGIIKLDSDKLLDIVETMLKKIKKSKSLSNNYKNLELEDRKAIINIIKEFYEDEDNVEVKLGYIHTLVLILEYEKKGETEIGNNYSLPSTFNLTI